MTKQTMIMGAAAKEPFSKAKSDGGLSKILVGIARETDISQDFSSAGNKSASSKRLSAVQAAAIAGKQLVELVSLPLDSVSSVTRSESGWQITVNLIELSRIPHSTDVISSYSIALREDGNIEGYRRIARYTRDQLGDDL
jgi:hypothetical protein